MIEVDLSLFGGSFDPPGTHHFWMAVDQIRLGFKVIVIPCGIRPEPEKSNLVLTAPHHRARMLELTFELLLGTGELALEFFDLHNQTFTRTHELQRMFEKLGNVSHTVGSDLLQDGRFGKSLIHGWEFGPYIFRMFYFNVFLRFGYPIDPEDVPVHGMVVGHSRPGSSTEIRQRIAAGKSIEGLVMPKVAGYIYEHGLYHPA